MTDFNSDDFLRQLHDKLHDYGADPPADTWAGIQSRLPAQKKDRRLLFYLSAAAALLLGVLGLGSWLYFGTSPTGSTGNGPLATARTVGGASVGDRARSGGSSADALAQPAAAETNAASATAAAADSYARTGAANRSNTPLKTAGPQRYTALGTADPATAKPTEDALTVLPSGKGAKARAARNGTYLRRGRTSGQVAARSGAAAESLTAADENTYGGSARASRAAKAAGRPTRYASAAGAARPDEARTGLRRSHRARRYRLAGPAGWAAEAAEVAGAPGRTGRASRLRAPGDALEPVAAAVARPEPEEPEVQRTKRNRAPRPTRRARILKNLTFNALAGTALTYRQLSAGGTAAQRQLANLERPALGYSAHVGLAYALNKRAKVSLGLGYHDYATRYLYQVQKGDGVTKVDQRDVYRYVTLPLQLQYQLAANHRYSVGWLAGASLGAYAGGRTTAGTACNCLQRDANDEAYRPWALTATAGGFLEYYLTPDVRLLLRPTLQYQLTSLTEATAGLPARHPWSVGLQTGLSFNLQDKPRPGAATAKR